MKVRVCKIFDFHASHILHNAEMDEETNRHVFGKCNQLHGHTYVLEVMCEGEPVEETGMVVNFRDIKALVRPFIDQHLEHKHLNDFVSLPTAENILLAIASDLGIELHKIGVCKMRLWETKTSYAEVDLG